MKLLERIDRPEAFCGTRCHIIGTTAALIAGGLAAAGSATSGILANKAAGTQADAALQASHEANLINTQQYNQNRADLGPYRDAGYASVSRLRDLLGIGAPTPGAPASPGSTSAPSDPYAKYSGMDFNSLIRSGDPNVSPDAATTQMWQRAGIPYRNVNGAAVKQLAPGPEATSAQVSPTPSADTGSLMKDFTLSDFTADPGYNFRLSEGQKALERSASATGSLFNGGTLKDLTQYNQDFASNEFGNAYSRFQQNRASKFNQLASIAGLGQTAVDTGVAAGTQTSNNIANTTVAGLTGAANARASGYGNIASSVNGGLNSIGTLLALSQYGQPKKPGQKG